VSHLTEAGRGGVLGFASACVCDSGDIHLLLDTMQSGSVSIHKPTSTYKKELNFRLVKFKDYQGDKKSGMFIFK
jgi:hypothetical protein